MRDHIWANGSSKPELINECVNEKAPGVKSVQIFTMANQLNVSMNRAGVKSVQIAVANQSNASMKSQ
jgi:hypothetical protein